jgi:hypothetical protein
MTNRLAGDSQARGDDFWDSWTVRMTCFVLAIILPLSGWWYFHNESFTSAQEYLRGDGLVAYPYRVSVGSGRTGEKREARFTVQNRTSGPIAIVGSQSSCGCFASSDRLPLTIRPGESHDFNVVVRFGETGEFKHFMIYYTDNADRPQIVFTLEGRVLSD